MSRVTLGRGLGALLPQAEQQAVITANVLKNTSEAGAQTTHSSVNLPPPVERIPGITLANPEDISPNPYQPRHDFDDALIDELAQSIKTNGLIQPLIVRKTEKGFQLIAGERRLRAIKKLGLKQIPVVIRKSTDKESLEAALIENIQRKDLNCVDEALAYNQLSEEFSLTQEQVSERVGKDRATIANHLRLLSLPEAVLDDLRRAILSFGHAKVLLSLKDRDQILVARKEIVEKKLSVRNTENFVTELLAKSEIQTQKQTTKTAENKPETTESAQDRFNKLSLEYTKAIGMRVKLSGGVNYGKIAITYSSRENLDRILKALEGMKS